MDERFLHYIWKFQKFSKTELRTTSGQRVVVLNQGSHNHHSGPDFEEARIKIGDIEWAGNVEIHIDSADWNKHFHHNDRAYDNVILHVVWENTQNVLIQSEFVPTLELKDIVNGNRFSEYQTFLSQEREILCEDQFKTITDLSFNNMLDRALVERLEQKSTTVLNLLEKENNDWEVVTYLSLAANFGFSLNKEPFSHLADSLPYKVISKYHNRPKECDALIFGQGGLLDEEADNYQKELRKEYTYLARKHQLIKRLTRSSWKFGRMRPPNFPSVRLSQFSSLMSEHEHLFSRIIATESTSALIHLFQIKSSEYWADHYDFGKKRKKRQKTIGRSSRENILINTIAPLLAAYSKYVDDYVYMERALAVLEKLRPETNSITEKWKRAGKKPENAFDSQALIGLFKNYCIKKRCLECNIGAEILGK
ncbi:MAG: DUF2851 family protein [Cyclobacteriaceae bacterium]